MEAAPVAEMKKSSLIKAIFSGSLGNVLEWFDYGLYGYFAVIISAEFFTSDDPIVSLLLSFLVFGTGFLVRPIGGIIIGAYADKHGRVKALTFTILAMGICTMLMGCLPTYAQVGVWAPILLTILRLFQGLACGGEFGSALTFIAEHDNGHNRAFLVSFQPFSVGCGMLIGSAVGLIVTSCLSQEDLYAWGWRVPFLCGILIALYGVYLRKNVSDSPEFMKMQTEMKESNKEHTPIKDLFVSNWKAIITVIGLLVGTSVTYYLLVTYLPTYIVQFVGGTAVNSFIVNTCVVAIYLVFCPIAGKFTDKVGRRKSIIIACIGFIVLSYPLFAIFVSSNNVAIMILSLAIIMIFQSLNAVAIATASADVFPAKLRNSGIGFAYNLAAAVFGGMAPMTATAIIAATGSALSITWFIIGAVLVTLLVAIFLLKGFYSKKA